MLFSCQFFLGFALCVGFASSATQLKVLAASEHAEFTVASINLEGNNTRPSLTKIPYSDSCPPDLVIRPYCNGPNCGSTTTSYSQLDLKSNERWLVFTEDYLVVFSQFDTSHSSAKVKCLKLPHCIPMATSQIQLGSVPTVQVHCAAREDEDFAVKVLTLHLSSGEERYSTRFCSSPEHRPNGVSAAIFSDADGNPNLAYTTDRGVSFCDFVDNVDTPLPNPENCPWVIKVSRFDDHTLLFECAANASSSIVAVAYTFSVSSLVFRKTLPVRNYHLGHLVFSEDKLYCATFQDSMFSWMNLTKGPNPLISHIPCPSPVVSAHLVTTGSSLRIMVVLLSGLYLIVPGKGQPHELLPSESDAMPTGNSLHLDIADNRYVGFVPKKSTIQIGDLENPKTPPVGISIPNPVRFHVLVLPPDVNPAPSPRDDEVYPPWTTIGAVGGGVLLALIVAVVGLVVVVCACLVRRGKVDWRKCRTKSCIRRSGIRSCKLQKYQKLNTSAAYSLSIKYGEEELQDVTVIANNNIPLETEDSESKVDQSENCPTDEIDNASEESEEYYGNIQRQHSDSSADMHVAGPVQRPAEITVKVEIHPPNPSARPESATEIDQVAPAPIRKEEGNENPAEIQPQIRYVPTETVVVPVTNSGIPPTSSDVSSASSDISETGTVIGPETPSAILSPPSTSPSPFSSYVPDHQNPISPVASSEEDQDPTIPAVVAVDFTGASFLSGTIPAASPSDIERTIPSQSSIDRSSSSVVDTLQLSSDWPAEDPNPHYGDRVVPGLPLFPAPVPSEARTEADGRNVGY